MKTIALIGASGYIGSALYKELQRNKNFNTQPVVRTNYAYWRKREFDIVINAAMPSSRFWAQNNPSHDFAATVERTADIVYNWKYQKLVQISTISARSEINSIYGRNKAAAEKICDFGENLIVRLTATFGNSLKKGVLVDIINNKKVYVSEKSRYSFASLDFVSKWISDNLQRKGLIEVGARNSLSLEAIIKSLKLSIKFEGRIDIQEVDKPKINYPDAKEVLSFLMEEIRKVK